MSSTDNIKVKAIFTYIGEGKKELFDKVENGDATYHVELAVPSDMIVMEKIMFGDVKFAIENYSNETGILKMSITPSIPYWVFNKFSGWIIPLFEETKS